jgi:hypothetical protein
LPRFSVCLARFPGGGVESAAATDWCISTVLKMKADPRIDPEILRFRISDTPITMGRNRAAKYALQQGADYLVMIDSDMDPDCELDEDPAARPFWESSWNFLMAHRDTPMAVAAPYVGPPPLENVYVFLWRGWETDRPGPDGRLEQFTREEAAVRTGFEEVAALPTGLIIYDTRVFKTMPPPWFEYQFTDQYRTHKGSTEDVVQTRDMSLAWHGSGGVAGGKCVCNWSAWAAHLKVKRCRKPTFIGVEQVAENYKQALLRGQASDERLMMIGGGDASVRGPAGASEEGPGGNGRIHEAAPVPVGAVRDHGRAVEEGPGGPGGFQEADRGHRAAAVARAAEALRVAGHAEDNRI